RRARRRGGGEEGGRAHRHRQGGRRGRQGAGARSGERGQPHRRRGVRSDQPHEARRDAAATGPAAPARRAARKGRGRGRVRRREAETPRAGQGRARRAYLGRRRREEEGLLMDVFAYNRDAWDGCVRSGNRWTVPVSSEVIARAREGEWSIVL